MGSGMRSKATVKMNVSYWAIAFCYNIDITTSLKAVTIGGKRNLWILNASWKLHLFSGIRKCGYESISRMA